MYTCILPLRKRKRTSLISRIHGHFVSEQTREYESTAASNIKFTSTNYKLLPVLL